MMLALVICLYMLLLSFAGRQKAIMDLIHEDKLSYKGYYWSKAAMTATKDKNKDGKVSFWESNFPKDAWHRAERFRVLSINCFIPTLSLVIGYIVLPQNSLEVVIVTAILIILLGWFLFSLVFLHYYEGTKKGKILI